MWYNYKTGEYENRELPEDFTDYIPQDPTALALYKLCLQMGESPAKAARSVLVAVAGVATGAAGTPADRSKTPYELSVVHTATCPRCGNGGPLALSPAGAIVRVGSLPAFLICANCLYIGQIGVGVVPRMSEAGID